MKCAEWKIPITKLCVSTGITIGSRRSWGELVATVEQYLLTNFLTDIEYHFSYVLTIPSAYQIGAMFQGGRNSPMWIKIMLEFDNLSDDDQAFLMLKHDMRFGDKVEILSRYPLAISSNSTQYLISG